jgi:hypothetical protein
VAHAAPALTAPIGQALRDAARLGTIFTIRQPGDALPSDVGWRPYTRLAEAAGPILLNRQVDVTAERLGTDLRRPAASVLHLGACAAICAPLLATAAIHAVVPRMSPAQLQFGYPGVGSLQLALTTVPAGDAGLLPELAGHLIDVALRRLLGPFTAALTTAVPLPETTLAGNVFSALAAAARLVVPQPAGSRARALVDLIARRHPPLHHAGVLHWRDPEAAGYFSRRNCCLFYQVPGGGTCGDCILAHPPIRQNATEYEPTD